MGRGRKGITEQSRRKPKRTDSGNCKSTIVFVKTEKQKKMPVPEHVVDFVKNMTPQQLVDLLLPS